MGEDRSDRIALDPTGRRVAVRADTYNDWFVFDTAVAKGAFTSSLPDDWTPFVPATDRDRLAEEVARLAGEAEGIASGLEAMAGDWTDAELEAGAYALSAFDHDNGLSANGEIGPYHRPETAAVLDAVAPLIAARVREPLLSLIEDLADDDPCWFDHHGYCQAHGWMATDPTCPDGRAKELLSKEGRDAD